jgi:hypothetical protein
MLSKQRFWAAVFLAAVIPTSALADHSWSNYHWARTSNSFDLTVINSTTSDWDGYVFNAVSDWSVSAALNMVEDTTDSTNSRVRRQCKAPEGMVRICNLAYGQNGWLGIAGISIDTNGHIIKGYTKLNDSYFSSTFYDTADWKQSVTCQELGHNIGLGHQDEDFSNESLFSCMDYQNPPFENPNGHDYDQLVTIYGHTDSYDSYYAGGSGVSGGDGGGSGCNAPPGKGCNKARPTNNGDIGWGVSLGRRGNSETFLRIDPDGTRHLTHVRWVDKSVAHDDH